MPKISIIMPVYNGEKFIKKTIDSILNQSFSDYELIIVDDGSVDDSYKIIHSYHDKRIRYFKNEKNSGIVFSLNRALGIASAEYIARIDADDICLENRFKIQLDFLENNKNVGVCSGSICYIDADGNEGITVRMPTSADECKVKFLFGNPIIHPASMFRRELAVKVGGYTEGMEPAEDYDFWLKLLEISEVQNVEEVLLKYRIHSSNYSMIKRQEYNQKFTEIFSKKSKLQFSDIIEDKFLNFHIRLIIGTWNEKSSLKEVLKLKLWRKSLVDNNNKVKAFDQKMLATALDYNISLILLAILKSRYNTLMVKLVSAINLLFFSPSNVLKIIESKKSK
jgi:glycosyltransferase involved in cell wall biosynthesis